MNCPAHLVTLRNQWIACMILAKRNPTRQTLAALKRAEAAYSLAHQGSQPVPVAVRPRFKRIPRHADAYHVPEFAA